MDSSQYNLALSINFIPYCLFEGEFDGDLRGNS